MKPEPASLFFEKDDFPYELGSGGRVYGLRLVNGELERGPAPLRPESVDKFWRAIPDEISREKAIELLRILQRSKFTDSRPPEASPPAAPQPSPEEIEAKQKREEYYRLLREIPPSVFEEVARMLNYKPEKPQKP